MMRKLVLTVIVLIFLTGLFLFGNYWINTQPIWLIDRKIDETFLTEIPTKNKEIIHFVEENGIRIAPNYSDVVCTEFVIKVIDKFDPLTNDQKNEIRILTNKNVRELIKNESAIIKGVQTALINANKGTELKYIEDVRPGDFVQFWNVYQGKEYGHCGVVFQIEGNKSLTLYSSHPLTDGFGIQKYLWPDKVYFVRLK